MVKKIKEKLKKVGWVVNIYTMLMYIIIPRMVHVFSRERANKIYYWALEKKHLNLEKPETFDEKLMWLKINIYYNNELITRCADKYEVRKYIEDKGLGHILNELYYVWDKVEEIDWGNLPDRYALKCNHGCGYNIICTGKEILDIATKEKLDIATAKKKLNMWLKEDYSKKALETNYKFIKRKIICEKYLETDAGEFPLDYKFFCCNGKIAFLYIMNNSNSSDDRYVYDVNWKQRYDWAIQEEHKALIPKCFDEMVRYAEILSEDFPFVRVDFYEVDGKVVFGELTFTPTGCVVNYLTDEAQKEFGAMIQLPEKK